jgi:IS5 family transposase
MLRLRKDQPSLWESVLPDEVLRLSEELGKVDALLEDERFFVPFRDKFSCHWGRPTVPIATYLRLMYLKFRYKLGYKALVKEVGDSFSWRRFCHLSFNDPIPDASTLVKLTRKYGETTVRALNEALVLKLKEEKMVRGRKLRLDTYVVEANIHYPTDTSLLGDGIKVITRVVSRLKKAGLAADVSFVNHTRKLKKVLSSISRRLRERVRASSPRLVKAKEELLKLTRKVVARGRQVLAVAEKEESKWQATAKQMMSQLRQWLELTDKVIGQTEAVLSGERCLPERLVSIFDPGARPIIRGKARNLVEFGRKVLFGEAEHGIVTTYQVFEGSVADSNLLRLGVSEHKRLFRTRLRAVAADRGFHSQENEDWLKRGGVSRVCLPHRGKTHRDERKPLWFRRLLRFRAGAEGRISVLHRKFRLDRSLMGGGEGTQIWIGFGMLAHNLWQVARRV